MCTIHNTGTATCRGDGFLQLPLFYYVLMFSIHLLLVQGHPVAKALCTAGIETTLIQDSAVFPIMSRVNKVIKGHRWHRDGGDQRRHWDLCWCSLSCLTTKVLFCSSKFYLLVIILIPLSVGQYLKHIYCCKLNREGITKVHTILFSQKFLIPVFDTFLFHMFISCRWIYIPRVECWMVLSQTSTCCCLMWS